ncbi:MAG: DUF4198 domain-containing protein [Nitrospirae bacterium]|jgi:nickel transport protein|nr:DUF4198 domain-containing protein [Nitrospirota bacterium]
MKKIVFFLVISIFLLAQTASAHHLWIEKEGDRFMVAWGHPPKIDPYEPNRIKETQAFDIKGKKVTLERKDEKDKVYLSSKADISMITLSFEGGYLVSTPDGKKRLAKREAQKSGLYVIDSFYSVQFVKSLFAQSDAVTKPAGLRFEIVPLKTPFALKADELLAVKVLFEGKPLGGISLEQGAHKEITKTDEDGIAHIRISKGEKQIIIAKYRIAAKDNPDADFLSYTTVLTIDLK